MLDSLARLMEKLSEDVSVRPGHGDSTTIGEAWRGHPCLEAL